MRYLPELIGAMCLMVFCTGAAHAALACSVMKDAALYELPTEQSAIIRIVPAQDLVQFPQQDLAPEQVEDWYWVKHDPTQEDIWQGGDPGWMQIAILNDCG
ncbi:hypothetical protein [Shimia thalassica]|uniref:hypothetical protein n=1 Tax=Shimia thalassica TaxID=1715693 RepID=UPI0027325223|nr:hypothetical protein [Shimia thalassica]MDP2517535.1 hypothetical protein [Shimia thalassica]